jgi:hypothetical protein
MKAIETNYKGYRFRSRLEARWAVYLDSLGLQWEYELQGFDLEGTRYLPDFWLPQVRMWAEVKPEEFSAEEYRKLGLLAKHSGHKCIMLVGVPECKAYDFVEWISPDECITTDCVLSMYHGYPIGDHRFYCSTGGL